MTREEETRTIPALVGRQRHEAQQALSALGLKVRLRRGRDRSQPPGAVTNVFPAAGERVAPGSTVTISYRGRDGSLLALLAALFGFPN